jgi:hypothetical protein
MVACAVKLPPSTRVSSHDLWRLPERAQEGAPHVIAIAKSGFARHDIDRVSALFHHQPGRFYAQVLDSPGGRLACLGMESATELARAQMRWLRPTASRTSGWARRFVPAGRS